MGEPKLRVLETEPLNASTPMSVLANALTPTESFFVRNHFPVPAIDPSAWRLKLQGLVERSMDISLRDLEGLDQRKVRVTFECAGNGRTRFDPPVPGVAWDETAVSTARFQGPRLRDVLELAGVQEAAKEAVFRGHDHGMEGGSDIHFERALPLRECRRETAIVALRMNGERLDAVHGAPARLVVPGWYGVANVKWLDSITLSATPFEGWFQKDRYVYQDAEGNVEAPVGRMRVKSLIFEPEAGARLRVGREVAIRGRAWAGGSPITSVQVSVDGGQAWQAAVMGKDEGSAAWRDFELRWTPSEEGEVRLVSRAGDIEGRVQPSAPVWNAFGYGQNAVAGVTVSVTGQ